MRPAMICALILALAACGKSAREGDDHSPPGPESGKAVPLGDITEGLIEEGAGVSGIRLGMTVAEVIALKGEPSSQNETADGVPLFMSYHASENFGVYLSGETGEVRMLIVSIENGAFCTAYDACLYREGDLAKIIAHHGEKLLRFVDRDGSVTYRLLTNDQGKGILTEWMPAEERNGVVQVTILHWDGAIDRSSFD